jgi:Ribosomal protein L11 methyltransferase (PrmA)
VTTISAQRDAVAHLRAALDAVGFDAASVAAALGHEVGAVTSVRERPVLVRRLAAGDERRATVRIVAHDPWLVASDPSARATERDFVTGLTRPATLLGNLIVRRRVPRALDIGTGNGILALLCSLYADRVVATDVNEHALSSSRHSTSRSTGSTTSSSGSAASSSRSRTSASASSSRTRRTSSRPSRTSSSGTAGSAVTS